MKHTILTFGPDAGIERDYRRWAYMADDVIADSGDGLGAKFATDDDGTRHWPYVKLAWGADNTYTIVGAGANAIPIADGGNSITVDGTITANTGSNLIGDVGLSGARTSGGTTLYRNVDADETEDQVTASATQLYWLHAMNLTAAVLYLQVYNLAAASVTVGTTTPDMTFPLATQGDTNGAGFVLAIPNGIALDTGLTIACTTTVGGASGPATNGCVVNLGYA